MEAEFLTENTTLSENATFYDDYTFSENVTLVLSCVFENCTANGTAGAGNGTAGAGARKPRGSCPSLPMFVLLALSYMIGIAGNTAALYILWSRHRAKRPRSSSKHALMLCCLAGNDLVALLGMLVQMFIKMLTPEELLDEHLLCVARVFWRLFGLGSGCVAAVMALERWLALTHPFLYQKHVTVELIFTSILCLWSHVLILVCLPFAGFGMYINKNGDCDRYRNATEPKDIAYAYLFFTFGTLLCFCIVWCNLAVVRALCHMNIGKNSSVGRRISRSSVSSSSAKCRRNAVSKSEAPTMSTKVTENAAIDLNTQDLVYCSSVEHDDNKQSSSHRLLKNSYCGSERVSPQCNCSSCSKKPMLSKSTKNNSNDTFNEKGSHQYSYNVCTSEEVAFARLMTVLSISFVVCWAPQMISILLAQFHASSRIAKIFFKIADLLMLLHFTIDPFVYVVLRNKQKKQSQKPCMPILKFLCRQCSEQSQITNEIELTEKCVSNETS